MPRPARTLAAIPAHPIELDILRTLQTFLALLLTLGTKGPFYLDASLLNLKASRLATGDELRPGSTPPAGYSVVPDLVVWEAHDQETVDFQSVAKAMCPQFDFFWNEFNFERALTYDAETREWRGLRWVLFLRIGFPFAALPDNPWSHRGVSGSAD